MSALALLFVLAAQQADDHGNAADAATVVQPGAPVAGTIDAEGDTDWFRFPAREGLTYSLVVSLDALHDSYLELYNTDGTTVLASDDDAAGNLASRIDWTCPASGDYYARVLAFGSGGTGTYSLTISEGTGATDDHGNDARSATPIDVGAAIDGIIEDPSDMDFFRFYANEGTGYLLHVAHAAEGGISDSYLELYDTAGSTMIASDDDSGGNLQPRIEWTAPSTGYYYVKVRPYSTSHQGAYTLQIDESGSAATPDDVGNAPDSAEPLALGNAATRDIQDANDRDYFSLELPAATRYTITVRTGTLGDSVLEVYGTDGTTQIGYSDDAGGDLGRGSCAVIETTDAGTYYAMVRPFSSSYTGSYTIDIVEGGDAQPQGPVVIPPVIVPGPGPGPGPLPADDHANSAAEADPIEPDAEMEASIENNGDQDWFQFDARAGVEYVFEARLGGLTDTYLELYDQDGASQLASNDDAHGDLGMGSRITWTAPDDGTFFVMVRAFGGGTGTYTLSMARSGAAAAAADDYPDASADAPALPVGGPIPGRIGSPGESDWFRFEIVAGQTYTVTVALGDLRDSVAELYQTDGVTQVASNDDGEGLGHGSRLEYAARETGTAFVRVRAFSEAQTGSYTVELAGPEADDHGDAGPQGTALPADRPIPGVLTAGDEDWFQFAVEEEDAYAVTVELGSLASVTIEIYNPGGALEGRVEGAGPDPVSISWPGLAGTTYFARVAPGDGGTGSYVVSAGRAGTRRRTVATNPGGDDHANQADGASAIPAEGALEGNLEDAGDMDWFSFEAQAGVTYSLDVELGTLSDSYLELYEQDGVTLIDQNDDAEGGGLASHLEFTPPATGTYYLKVRGFAQHDGTYTLRATRE